jgi:fibronectin type 3 domain-containing protein
MFRARGTFYLSLVVFFLFLKTAPINAKVNSLAIFNLRPTNIDAMGYDAEIIFTLISALERDNTIELMPRRQMEDSLFQAGMIQGGDPQTIARAGKVLGINYILFGDVTKKGAQISTQFKLLDVQNKRVIKTWDKAFSGHESILEGIPAFAKELGSAMVNKEQSYAVPAAQQLQPAIDIENLKAKSQGKKVVLTWKFDHSQPIVAFHVYRSEHAEGPYQFNGKTDKDIFEDISVKKGRSYYYHIRILTSSGQEIKSSQTAQVKSVGEKVPHPPLILSSNGYVRRTEIKFVPSLLNEQEKFKITTYKFYRKKSTEQDWENTFSIDTKALPKSKQGFVFADKDGLDDGQAYTYAISSLDKKMNESPLSDSVSIQTINRPVLSVEKDDLLREIDLAWQPMERIEGYYLYRKGDENDWQRVAKITAASKSRHSDKKNLEDAKNYQYHLTAYDSKGETGPSKEVIAKTKELPPFPNDIQAQGGLVKAVKLTWTFVDDPDVDGYAVYRGTDVGALERVAKVKGYKTNHYLDKGTALIKPLEDGKDYYYALASCNLFGAEGKPTQVVQVKTKPRPAMVNGFMAKAAESHILVSWEKNAEPDIKNYILFRKSNSSFWSKIKELDAGQTSYKDAALKPDAEYLYKILAKDKDSLKSDPVESDVVPSPIIKANK